MAQPFSIHIDQAALDDLAARLRATRWPPQLRGDSWEYGTDKSQLEELCRYWQDEFDWRKQETVLNKLSHFKTGIDDIELHYIVEKGKGERTVPLLLIHGFPDSFIRFLKIIPLLTAPDEDGYAFDLVIPSLPGYGFSGIPPKPGMNPSRIADIFYKLMTQELGYHSFFAHGGDWGSTISEQLALKYDNSITGIHLTEIPFIHLLNIPQGKLMPPEKKYLEAGQQWQRKEGAYAMIQSTKPQTLSYALNDSPAGLAAWIIEKFFSWSANQGKLEDNFSKDELLTNLTIYWCTETINSAMHIYYEAAQSGSAMTKVNTPTGVAIFPKDLVTAPREYAQRFFNIVHWTDMPAGGHFAAMEQPQLLAGDIRRFIKMLL